MIFTESTWSAGGDSGGGCTWVNAFDPGTDISVSVKAALSPCGYQVFLPVSQCHDDTVLRTDDPICESFSVAANAIVRFAHLVLSVGSYIKAKVRRVFTYLREGYCRPHFHGSRKRVCFFRL